MLGLSHYDQVINDVPLRVCGCGSGECDSKHTGCSGGRETVPVSGVLCPEHGAGGVVEEGRHAVSEGGRVLCAAGG